MSILQTSPATSDRPVSVDPPLATSAKDVLQLAASSLALVALPLWAIGHWALTSYFSVLGLTPEQVGIDKQTLLARVAVLSAILIGVAVPPAVSLGLLFGWFYLRTPLRWLRADPRVWSAARALAAALALGAAFASTARFASLATAAVTSLVLGAIVFGPMMYIVGRLPRPALLQTLTVLAVLTVSAALWAGGHAQSMAEELRDRGTVAPMTEVLGVRPVLADAAWTDSDGRARHEAVIYLGEQGGVSTLRPCSERTVQRVPTAQVRLAMPGPVSSLGSWASRACRG